jgi:hypothetical protein
MTQDQVKHFIGSCGELAEGPPMLEKAALT